MRIKDRKIYSTNQEYLIKLREEYILYGDARTSIEPGCLTIHAYRRKPKETPKKKKRKTNDKD